MMEVILFIIGLALVLFIAGAAIKSYLEKRRQKRIKAKVHNKAATNATCVKPIWTTTSSSTAYTLNVPISKKKVRATKFDKKVYYFRDKLWHPFNPAIDGQNVKLEFDPKVKVDEEPTHTIREQYNDEAVMDKGISFVKDDE